MKEQAAIRGPIGKSGIAQEAIHEELSRILESPLFAQSDRLGRFLRYTVETTLAGKAKTLKEYSIGVDVYERKPPYHPSSDSIVRSEARRLRRKLKEYYESSGIGDSVFIYYRPGSYVPVFRRREKQKSVSQATERALKELLTEGAVARAIKASSRNQDFDIQIVFEGTIRILPSKAESRETREVEFLPIRSKPLQLRKAVGMSSTKGNPV
jgi:hypothetical protein